MITEIAAIRLVQPHRFGSDALRLRGGVADEPLSHARLQTGHRIGLV
jgi:hypothetical protein